MSRANGYLPTRSPSRTHLAIFKTAMLASVTESEACYLPSTIPSGLDRSFSCGCSPLHKNPSTPYSIPFTKNRTVEKKNSPTFNWLCKRGWRRIKGFGGWSRLEERTAVWFIGVLKLARTRQAWLRKRDEWCKCHNQRVCTRTIRTWPFVVHDLIRNAHVWSTAFWKTHYFTKSRNIFQNTEMLNVYGKKRQARH